MSDVKQLFQKSEDELLVEIGHILSKNDLTALPRPIEELKDGATRWIQANWESIKRQLCSNQTIRQLAAKGFSAELVAMVLALLEKLSLGTAVSPLAVLLCKRGLQGMCSDYWT
jgi:hypothetical protein